MKSMFKITIITKGACPSYFWKINVIMTLRGVACDANFFVCVLLFLLTITPRLGCNYPNIARVMLSLELTLYRMLESGKKNNLPSPPDDRRCHSLFCRPEIMSKRQNFLGYSVAPKNIYSETSINDHSEKRPNSLQRPNYLPPIHSSIELMYF